MDVGQARRPVVVGVDGSESAYQAVEWAAAEAARRGAALRLVGAFSWTASDQPTWHPLHVTHYHDQMLEITRRQLAHGEQIAAQIRPGVETTTQVEIGAPIEVLESEAQRAQLLVLGDAASAG